MQVELTRYYVVAEDDYDQANLIPIKDVNNTLIARTNAHFFAAMSLEGSGRLASGQMLNVSGNYVPCDPDTSKTLQAIAQQSYHNHYGYVGLSLDASKYFAYFRSPTKWGVGVKGERLYPFVSVAADFSVFPLLTKLYAPQLQGLQLPNGETHGGYLYVQDTGSAIKGAHLDWFVGLKDWELMGIVPDEIDVEVVGSG